jgi:hypothetical protein
LQDYQIAEKEKKPFSLVLMCNIKALLKIKDEWKSSRFDAGKL